MPLGCAGSDAWLLLGVGVTPRQPGVALGVAQPWLQVPGRTDRDIEAGAAAWGKGGAGICL